MHLLITAKLASVDENMSKRHAMARGDFGKDTVKRYIRILSQYAEGRTDVAVACSRRWDMKGQKGYAKLGQIRTAIFCTPTACLPLAAQ